MECDGDLVFVPVGDRLVPQWPFQNSCLLCPAHGLPPYFLLEERNESEWLSDYETLLSYFFGASLPAATGKRTCLFWLSGSTSPTRWNAAQK